MFGQSKSVWGWALYDWANSAYVTTVMAGFFPVFFKSYWSAGADVNLSTAQLGLGNALASLFVALMAPVLGAIADKGSAKKKFLIFFAYLGVIMAASLFFVQKGQWAWAIFLYVMGVIGFSGANVFYDALLPSVTGEDKIDFVSGLGFSMGYLGGGLLFLVNVIMTLKPALFGFADAGGAVRFSFLTVALWWGGFTVLTILWVKEEKPKLASALTAAETVRAGIAQLVSTFKKIRHLKTVFLFLFAYWLYIDGVDTIIRMAVDYGLSLGFQSTDLILALLITQFVGFPAAIVFGKLGQRWNVKKSDFPRHRRLYLHHDLGRPDDEQERVLHARGHGGARSGRSPGAEPVVLFEDHSEKPGGGVLRLLQYAGEVRRDTRPRADREHRAAHPVDADARSPHAGGSFKYRTARFPVGNGIGPDPFYQRGRIVPFRRRGKGKGRSAVSGKAQFLKAARH